MATTLLNLISQCPTEPEAFNSMFQNNPENLWTIIVTLRFLAIEVSVQNSQLQTDVQNLREQTHQLQVNNQTYHEHNIQLQANIQNLQEQLRASQPTSQTPSTASTQSTTQQSQAPIQANSIRVTLSERLPDPAEFTGDRQDFERFKSQIHNKMVANLDRYTTPQQRMVYVCSRLTGAAYSQILPYLKEGVATLGDYKDILNILETAFGDPNRVANAQVKLFQLRQKNQEFSTFLAEFQRLCLEAKYSEGALVVLLEQNISQELRSLFISSPPPSYEFKDFVKHLQDLDNRLRQFQTAPRQLPRMVNNAPFRPRSPGPVTPLVPFRPASINPQTSVLTTDPMDLSRTGNRAKVSESERERRRQQGLCFYCGGQHMRVNCPNQPRRSSPSPSRYSRSASPQGSYAQVTASHSTSPIVQNSAAQIPRPPTPPKSRSYQTSLRRPESPKSENGVPLGRVSFRG